MQIAECMQNPSKVKKGGWILYADSKMQAKSKKSEERRLDFVCR